MTARMISRSIPSGLMVAVFAALQIGCGELTIRTWINVDEANSSGVIQVLPTQPGGPWPPPITIDLVQGGFLTAIQVDTRDLPGAMEGTAVVEDIRMAGASDGVTGDFCAWRNPAVESGGPVVLDLLGGTSTATVTTNLLSTTTLSEQIGLPPIALNPTIALDISEGLGIDSFLEALNTGTVAGTIATETAISQIVQISVLKAVFGLNLALVNADLPTVFDPDLQEFCGPFFDAQEGGLYYGLNAKSSYLRADDGDNPLLPLAIPLDELGAEAGDTLRITRVGTYASGLQLKDGNEHDVTAVFSATDVVLGDHLRYRVPDAIDAGDDVYTSGYLKCLLLLCWIEDTNIPEDFDVDPAVDVVVPSGAEFLIVAPYDTDDHEWENNGGFSLGVEIEVNP